MKRKTYDYLLKWKQEELYRKLMLDKLELNKGMLVENIVAQMLRASGHELYFYSSYSKTTSEDTMEIDFLVHKPTISSRHNISPIEVKSSKTYTFASLNNLSPAVYDSTPLKWSEYFK